MTVHDIGYHEIELLTRTWHNPINKDTQEMLLNRITVAQDVLLDLTDLYKIYNLPRQTCFANVVHILTHIRDQGASFESLTHTLSFSPFDHDYLPDDYND